MPFEEAAKTLKELTGVQVSKSTARRCTLETGKAALEGEEQEREQLQRELPEPPPGAKRQAMSADGAMVPLVGGEWGEVKTLIIADVSDDEQGEVSLEQLSSVSRLTNAETFAKEALLETHRRGLAKAREVCAVQDGAEWLQGLTDYHRSDALRILDFVHASEYVADIAEIVKSAGVQLPKNWLDKQLHKLKHKGPKALLQQVYRWVKQYPHLKELKKKVAYLQKREKQMQYPEYQAAGWPIGSGMVESANKIVVEARLKGAGMHWDPAHVNKMLILRNALYNDRWKEMWKKSRVQLGKQRKLTRQTYQKECYQVACYKLTRLLLHIQLFCPSAMGQMLAEREKPTKSFTTKNRPSITTQANASSTIVDILGTPARKHPVVPASNQSTSSVIHRPSVHHPWRKPFLKRSANRSLPQQEPCAKI